MQVIIAATSSVLDNNMVLIETSVTIGDSQPTIQRVGYDKQELMDNRYLSGTFEERVEALRQSAERMTETSVKLHFQALAKIASPEALVTDVAFSGVGVKATQELAEKVEQALEAPAKKTRKPRTPKAAQ